MDISTDTVLLIKKSIKVRMQIIYSKKLDQFIKSKFTEFGVTGFVADQMYGKAPHKILSDYEYDKFMEEKQELNKLKIQLNIHFSFLSTVLQMSNTFGDFYNYLPNIVQDYLNESFSLNKEILDKSEKFNEVLVKLQENPSYRNFLNFFYIQELYK